MSKKNVKKYSKAITKIQTKTPSPFSQEQLLFILQKTPANHIYHRKAKGIGGDWEYVTGTYVKKVLNYCFGWRWDFEIKEHGREGNSVWVLGRLTIKDKSNKPIIIKEQFGRADIKYYRDTTKGMLDFGNDLKAAATDALKKCASEIGIASDVYGKNEFQEIQTEDKGFIPPKVEVINLEIQTTEPVQKSEPIGQKVEELKSMLKGKTDEEKINDLKKKTGIILKDFKITESHAIRLIGELLNQTVKN